MSEENDFPNEDPNEESPESQPSGSLPEFGLNEPTGQFADLDRRGFDSVESVEPVTSMNVADDDLKYKNMGWKGIDDEEEEEEDDEPDVRFGKKEPIPEDELDMTPMVDVTFLLLIFFMVTASFTIQKSLQQPHAKSDAPSIHTKLEEKDATDYVQVLVDQTNTFYVTTRDNDELECPSDSEMRAQVLDGFKTPGVERLIIVAHMESLHEKVVTAWDAGVVGGANQIEIQTTEEDY